jgi:transposase, IS5 family
MAVKRTGQLSFVEAMLPEGLRGSGRLDRLGELVKWYRFEKCWAGFATKGQAGRAICRC